MSLKPVSETGGPLWDKSGNNNLTEEKHMEAEGRTFIGASSVKLTRVWVGEQAGTAYKGSSVCVHIHMRLFIVGEGTEWIQSPITQNKMSRIHNTYLCGSLYCTCHICSNLGSRWLDNESPLACPGRGSQVSSHTCWLGELQLLCQ